MTDDSDAEAGTVAVECGFGVAAQRGGACGSPSARARRIGGGDGNENRGNGLERPRRLEKTMAECW